jgi:glycosyltransferase involved in cell wall biosynthesis
MSECIVFFATAWGSHYGGINSFNYDLCKALAKLTAPSLSVVCIVEDDIVEDEDEDKDKLSGLKLWSLPPARSSKGDIDNVVDKLKSRQLTAVYLIGHDVHTGPRAIAVSKHLNVPVAVFHHMDYRAYKPFQGKNDREQLAHQEKILKEANIVFAIGPKLEKSANDKIRGKQIRVVKVQPGLAEIEPIEMPSCFSAITFGRVNRENTLLKQINLAVASFGKAAGNEANSLGEDPRIVVIGLSEEEQDTEYQSLKSLVEQYAGKAVSIHGWLYDNNRDNLFKELKGHSVCMMLSIYEAFGLVGLEAISAGIPLILSQNTGLYKAITQPPPNGLGITYPYAVEISGSFREDTLPSKDIQEVVKHLYAIATNKDEAKRKAKRLREELLESWTWKNAARQVLTGLEDILKPTPTNDTSQILEMDSKTILENLQYSKNLDACRHAIYETAIWLERHPDEPYIRRQYLVLVREKGLLEQQQIAITKMSLWLQENLENCDPYVFTEYLKLIKNSRIPKEQCHEAIVQSSTWLSEHPDESYVLRQYLALVREKGTPEQSQEAISKMTLWLEEPGTNCDRYVFWEYLRLINQEGTSQQQQTAINQADIWFQKHPDDSYVRREYLKLMGKQR